LKARSQVRNNHGTISGPIVLGPCNTDFFAVLKSVQLQVPKKTGVVDDTTTNIAEGADKGRTGWRGMR
jgi:hypothetical protein